MKTIHFIFVIAVSATLAAVGLGQSASRASEASSNNGAQGTPAYAEIVLKSTAVAAELESLLLDYTEDFPRVKELKFEHGLLEKEKSRLRALKPDQVSKLSLALGKLIVQRVELETDLWKLSENYKEEHPDVRRVKRKLEIYQKAIAEIMG